MRSSSTLARPDQVASYRFTTEQTMTKGSLPILGIYTPSTLARAILDPWATVPCQSGDTVPMSDNSDILAIAERSDTGVAVFIETEQQPEQVLLLYTKRTDLEPSFRHCAPLPPASRLS